MKEKTVAPMSTRTKLIAGVVLVFAVFDGQVAYAVFQGLEDRLNSQFKKLEKQYFPSKDAEKQNQNDASGENQDANLLQTYATPTKAVNLRLGPGTQHEKIMTLPPNSIVTVIGTDGNWLNVKTWSSSGAATEGWAYKPVFKIHAADFQPPAQPGAVDNSQQASPGNAYPHGMPGQTVEYAGYSKEFQPVKQMLALGDLHGVEKFYTEKEEKIIKKNSNQSDWNTIQSIGLLRWMERGTLYLDQGSLEKSIQAFANAENILEVRNTSGSKVGDAVKSAVGFVAETLVGNEEIRQYSGEGYEKVLMLNYKSIAYLLEGDRKAYNVARRAIDWQNIEKELFQAKLEKAKQDLKNKDNSNTNAEWTEKYEELDSIAIRVPSAFVNPFGYYVNGMIQEFESKDDPSLRDNARIAYSNALQLNPQSKVLQQAVAEMESPKKRGNKRLVHIVVADGFVPEKKMLVYQIFTHQGMLPVKLTLYEPVSSSVDRIEIQTVSGKRLAEFSPVADVEAICLRHQKDTEPFRMLRVALSTARAIGINSVASNAGFVGQIFKKAVDDSAAPDMRSWMSLPARIQAARLHIGKNIKHLKIVSYNKEGQSLSDKTVAVNQESDTFIYARSIENQIYTNEAKTLWVAGG